MTGHKKYRLICWQYSIFVPYDSINSVTYEMNIIRTSKI